jgi:hypothetical protein
VSPFLQMWGAAAKHMRSSTVCWFGKIVSCSPKPRGGQIDCYCYACHGQGFACKIGVGSRRQAF